MSALHRLTEMFEIELCGIETRSLGNGLAMVEHVVLSIAGWGWKYEFTAGTTRLLFEQVDQFNRDRRLTLLPALRIEPEFRFGGHARRLQLKIEIGPERCTTSISRKPVNKKVEKSVLSASYAALKNFVRSPSRYSRGNGVSVLAVGALSLLPIGRSA